MTSTFCLHHNIVSSLGFTTQENIDSMLADRIGIRITDDSALTTKPVPLARVDNELLNSKFLAVCDQLLRPETPALFTRLEKMLIISIYDVLKKRIPDPGSRRTQLIISTTKGNIELLEDRLKTQFNHKRVYLWELARVIQTFFGFVNTPVLVDSACISGSLALIIASRFLQNGQFDDVIVAGGDILSEFVISGFQSFQALSPNPCRPFDAGRDGLSIGESAGTIHLSAHRKDQGKETICITGYATTNDANHISGPSRTGEPLGSAIGRAIKQADITADDVDLIAAHGTATLYNDEMESQAIGLAGLSDVPVLSHKGYWGHTLGAAGIIESIATITSLSDNMLYRSAGYETSGLPVTLNVVTEHRRADLHAALKTASGFGGCNAALIFQKL